MKTSGPMSRMASGTTASTSGLRSAALVLALAATAACGAEDPPALSLIVRIDPQLAVTARNLSIFALAPLRSDGIFLTCSNLQSNEIAPTDERIEAYDRKDIAFTGDDSRSVTLENIVPGEGRLVFGLASDAQSRTIATGCTDDVVVVSGQSVDVELVLFRVN